MGVLEGKIAIVTGAGQGIGRGVALALAKEGARLTLVGRTEEKIASTAREIRAAGGDALVLARDVSDRAACDEVVATTVATYGALDILVNNAGVTSFTPLEEITDEEVQSVLGSSLLATLYLMQAAFAHMKDRGGKIINFGSGAGTGGSPRQAIYAAAKEGVRGLSKAAAKEWGPYRINVNTICPGALTPMSEAAGKIKGRSHEAWAAAVPLRRLGDPEHDIGRACVFLAGPDSDYITGRTLHVDGGNGYYDM